MSLDPIPIWNALCRLRFPCRKACRPPRARRAARRARNGGRRAEKQARIEASRRAKQIPYATLMLEYSPPWLVSMVFHMVALIIMGLIIFSQAAHAPGPVGRRGGVVRQGRTNRWIATPRWACPRDRPTARLGDG